MTLLVALAVALAAGGCAVEVVDQFPVSPKVAQVLDEGRGNWDLRSPPSREEAGIPSGEADVFYSPRGRANQQGIIRARVRLPEGKVMDTEAVIKAPNTAPTLTSNI